MRTGDAYVASLRDGRAVFLDGANEIWCVQKLQLDRMALDAGSDDGGSGASRGRANP